MRALALAAAANATRTGHRFSTRLDLAYGPLRARATLTGRRTPENSSVARIDWTGAAGLLLRDMQLRIIDDQLYTQPGPPSAPWQERGSASGVSLDVGRELLDHDFLLTTTAAWGDERAAAVAFTVPADRVREYATTERRGPVTDLLRSIRRLTLVAHVRDGRLVGDQFTLVTSTAGRPMRIVGATRYCPLRSTDRAPIPAPRIAATSSTR